MKKSLIMTIFLAALIVCGLLFRMNVEVELPNNDPIKSHLNFDDFDISIHVGLIRLSYNTFKVTPSDNMKIKAIFRDNQLIDDFSVDKIPNDCIKFEIDYPESGLDHYVLLIDPVSKLNWCYSFNNSDYAYAVNLKENDMEFLISLQDKYSVIAKQIGFSIGDVSLIEKLEENEQDIYKFNLEYPQATITELYIRTSFKDAGSSGRLYPLNFLDDGRFKISIPEMEYPLKEIKIIVRGYEIIGEEEVPFQNIFYFRGPIL